MSHKEEFSRHCGATDFEKLGYSSLGNSGNIQLKNAGVEVALLLAIALVEGGGGEFVFARFAAIALNSLFVECPDEVSGSDNVLG